MATRGISGCTCLQTTSERTARRGVSPEIPAHRGVMKAGHATPQALSGGRHIYNITSLCDWQSAFWRQSTSRWEQEHYNRWKRGADKAGACNRHALSVGVKIRCSSALLHNYAWEIRRSCEETAPSCRRDAALAIRRLCAAGRHAHPPRRRVAASKITAAARTAPLAMYWIEISTPIRFMPLVSDPMTSAPMSEPNTLPTPPAADTPPT